VGVVADGVGFDVKKRRKEGRRKEGRREIG
jgi:hypothetical protein